MKKKVSPFLWVAVGLALLLIIGIIVGVTTLTNQKLHTQELEAQIEQQNIDMEQIRLDNEVNAINLELSQYEDQTVQIKNDTLLAKYNDAKARIKQLQKELKTAREQNSLNRQQITKLQAEIETLRGILRHYVAQIDSLSKENGMLRAENQQMRTTNEQLTTRVAEATATNENLSQRMALAEKLNVTGVSLTPLKKGGKTEKNVTKAKQLKVTFTIPQNNSTPAGAKKIFCRIINPEGFVLGGGGSFKFEGQTVPSTASTTVEYGGNEISGITIYWDVNTTLNPGTYQVELFTDGYRLTRKSFTLKK